MQKAQGALEYLLLIGGAILVSAISISLMVTLTAESEVQAIAVGADAICSKFPANECNNKTFTIKDQTFACHYFGANKCRTFDGVLLLKLDDGGEDPGNIVKDISGNGNDGVLQGTTTCNVSGKHGKGCDFSGGTDGYILVSDDDTLDFGANQSFTVSFWFNATSWGGFDMFIDKRIYPNPGGYQFYCDNSNCNFRITEAGTNYKTTDPRPSLNEWHHVVAMRDPAQLRFWIDGVEVAAPDTSTAANIENINDLCIGNECSGSLSVQGTMDEVKVWRRALSDEEITQLAKG